MSSSRWSPEPHRTRALARGDTRAAPPPEAFTAGRQPSATRRRPSPELPCWRPDLRLPGSRTVEKTVLFQCPVCGISLQQPEPTLTQSWSLPGHQMRQRVCVSTLLFTVTSIHCTLTCKRHCVFCHRNFPSA